MKAISLAVDGMGCGGCVKKVRQALEALPGLAVENVALGSAALAYDPVLSSREAIVEALARAGYPAREVEADVVIQEGGDDGRAS